jgi:hypothetical protein
MWVIKSLLISSTQKYNEHNGKAMNNIYRAHAFSIYSKGGYSAIRAI